MIRASSSLRLCKRGSPARRDQSRAGPSRAEASTLRTDCAEGSKGHAATSAALWSSFAASARNRSTNATSALSEAALIRPPDRRSISRATRTLGVCSPLSIWLR